MSDYVASDVVKDEVLKRESLDDARSVGVDMIINLFVYGLSVLANARAKVSCQSQNVEEKITVRIVGVR